MIEPGAIAETVTVTGMSPIVQTMSGERSFAVTAEQIDTLPFARLNFTAVTAFTPGVVPTGASAGGTRLGGASQNNIMMDGISAMDTGNNGQMLNMNIDAIGEVKILTQGYQAEFGRSSGLQITAVTKSGSNRFRGSAYDRQTRLRLGREQLGQPEERRSEAENEQQVLGYTIGGPIGKPGGNNKLFFFYAHEYRPTSPRRSTTAIRSGFRVPTAAERAGDFSQTVDNTGALFNLIKDPSSTLPCTAANTAGCFQAGGVLGKIPSSALIRPGPRGAQSLSVTQRRTGPGPELQLRSWRRRSPTTSRSSRPSASTTSCRRTSAFTGKYYGQRARKLVTPGTIPGFNDVLNPYPVHHQLRRHRGLVINNSTFSRARTGSFAISSRAARDRRHPHRRHAGQRFGESAVEPSGFSAALSERGRCRSALLRVRRDEQSESGLV